MMSNHGAQLPENDISARGRQTPSPGRGKQWAISSMMSSRRASSRRQMTLEERTRKEEEDKAKREEEARRQSRIEDYIHRMRGWALTVATLLVGMAFQAALHPPQWIPSSHTAWLDTLLHKPPAGGGGGGGISKGQAARALAYLIFNTVTFSMALTLVVLLMLPKELAHGHIVKPVAIIIVLLTFSVTCNFVIGISDDARVTFLVVGIIVFIAVSAALIYFLAALTLPESSPENLHSEDRPAATSMFVNGSADSSTRSDRRGGVPASIPENEPSQLSGEASMAPLLPLGLP
ncbi:hypothetical protein ACP4OV_006765 [Aristida adscensionis]